MKLHLMMNLMIYDWHSRCKCFHPHGQNLQGLTFFKSICTTLWNGGSNV